jgi:hypothetical protein
MDVIILHVHVNLNCKYEMIKYAYTRLHFCLVVINVVVNGINEEDGVVVVNVLFGMKKCLYVKMLIWNNNVLYS